MKKLIAIKSNREKFLVFNTFDFRNIERSQDIEQSIVFEINGNNYQERRENLREKAMDFLDFNYDNENVDTDFSWNEINIVCSWFETAGAKLGLLKEFKENGIC